MSSVAYPRLLAALEAHGSERNGRGFQCPAHEDRVASLAVSDGDDRVLIHCHAGCDTLDVLEAIGLGWRDLFDEPATGKGWSTGTLKTIGAKANGDGRIQLGGVKYKPGASSGEPKSLAVKGSKRDLWPAPETTSGSVIYVVEGEPDAVTAAEIGLPAVAVPGSGKWRSEWAERIGKGRRRVVILPDADEPGRKAAQTWASSVAEHCADVRILDLAPERDDGFDLGAYAADVMNDDDRADVKRAMKARPGP